jgi:Flp pilus assembly pilin Flp
VIIKFTYDEAGASAVEYALLLSFIALAIVISVTTFGAAIRDSFLNSTTKMFGGS